MKYSLSRIDSSKEKEKGVLLTAYKRLLPLMIEERAPMLRAFVALLINSATVLSIPLLIVHIVDTSIAQKDWQSIVHFSIILLGVFVIGLIANYIQIKTMGGVGRRVLFQLRNKVFNKLQELPVAFFNQNKTGDLISRINNDTDKLSQFFAQALMQFVSNGMLIVGTGIFLLVINFRMGVIALLPAIVALIVTQFISPWVKRTNLASLRSVGAWSGEIQESINNFKVIVAFNRLDYFRNKLQEYNEANYQASLRSGIASNVFNPLYAFVSSVAQLFVLAYGVSHIVSGDVTVGLLIGFLLYVNSFYTPLRQLATVWSSLQTALAGLDRISEILALESDTPILLSDHQAQTVTSNTVLEFKNVFFRYDEDRDVLKNVSFALEAGKTYAFVGPTGGGKTTTASLMARLYDANSGEVLLEGRDIRSYEPNDRVKKIGFILQEPFLFTGTVRDNILYGNEKYAEYTNDMLHKILEEDHLTNLLARFANGLETKISASSEGVSLGQRQLIAFMRAVLRHPDLLILDEATANIDTVTEQLLDEILNTLPKTTTKVVIAHRLNTIENADSIFFVNDGRVALAGSMQQAVDMLLHNARNT